MLGISLKFLLSKPYLGGVFAHLSLYNDTNGLGFYLLLYVGKKQYQCIIFNFIKKGKKINAITSIQQ